MLVIRFARTGRKNRAQFRIVVQEHTAAPNGRHTEVVGSWDPHSKNGVFKNERIEYWVSQGAQVSDSVYNILVSQEVLKGKKRVIKLTAKKGEEEENSDDSKKEDGTTDKEVKKEEKTEEVKDEKKKEDKEEKTEEKKEEEPKEKEVKKEDK